MRIEFDPTNPTEAAAVRAMLTAVQPQEERRFATWISEKLNDVDMSTDGPSDDPDELERVEAEVKELLAAPVTDSTGTPWDERIHSTPATTNKDGTWRAKRGVTADQIAAVRAEREHDANLSATDEEMIEQAQPLEVASYVEIPGDTPSEKVAEAFAELSSAPKPPAPPASEPAVSAPAAPPAPPSNAPSNPSFLDVMKAITAAQKDGKIDTAKVKELCAAVGAGESTMGLNGPDNGDKRVAFMALLASEVAA